MRAAIAQWITEGGLDDQTEAFRAQHAQDIPRRTFYRWLKEARLALSSVAHEKFVAAAREAASDAPERAATAVAELIPKPVGIADIMPFTNFNAVRVIHDSIRHSEAVIDTLCLNADGKPKNGKLLLSAANGMVRAVDTLTRVAERYNDAQRVDQISAAIIDEVRKCSPETADRILKRINAVLAVWGFIEKG